MNIKTLRRICRLCRWTDRILLLILLAAAALSAAALWDCANMVQQGRDSLAYQDFKDLQRINPDICGWLVLDQTPIDHPVLQGRDNFEYLDLNYRREYYPGGSLFLDYRNDRSFHDSYSVIHGHHMEGGAMFGSLEKLLDRTYFTDHRTGRLLTPSWDYDLEIMGAGKTNAYDPKVYGRTDLPSLEDIGQICERCRDTEPAKQMLLLSTCSGALNDERIVVFCRLYNKVKHE